jgi:hypothetical protein
VGAEDDSGPHDIDPTVRNRVVEQFPVMTEALDAALANATDETLDNLREATDKLMRALGRVILEVERRRGGPKR